MSEDSDSVTGGARRDAKSAQAAQIVEALLEAATAMLSSPLRGAAISMRRIARLAGVSIGSVYYYFENQEDLLVRLVRRENEALASRLRALLANRPVTTIKDDVDAVLADVEAWRADKGWLARIPITQLLRRDLLPIVLDQSVATFADVIEEVCRRNRKRLPSRDQIAHVVVYLLAVQSLWALEYGPARELREGATLLTGFFAQLEDD